METCRSVHNINIVKIKKYIYFALLIEMRTIYKMQGTYIEKNIYT